MFLAEWKKLLRQRWFLGLALAFLLLNASLFLYRQQTEHGMWLHAAKWYPEYLSQYNGKEKEEAENWIIEESTRLSDYQMVALALEEENAELLEILKEQQPDILEAYEASGFMQRSEELEGRFVASSSIRGETDYIRAYPEFLSQIRTNYQRMRDNAFYDDRPYVRALGEKTVTDFRKLDGISLEPGMSYGIIALLENTSADLLILILVVCVCAMTIMPEQSRDLFGLMKSCKNGRARLAGIKLLTVMSSVALLCVLFYGSLFLMTMYLYGLGPLSRPIQSIELLGGSSRLMSVGWFLADTYFRTTLSMVAIACLMECVVICLKNPLIAIGILVAGGGVFAGLHRAIAPTARMSWLHLLNPMEWFSRVEAYGSYYAVSVFGRPVNIVVMNLILVCLLLAISFGAGIYVFSFKPMTARRMEYGIFGRFVGRMKERIPYPGHMFFQEWGKQLGKNRLLFLLILSGAAIWLVTEKHPVNLNQTDRQYRSYIDAFGGPMSQKTMDGILAEQERLYKLTEELDVLGMRLEAGEITEERYKAAQMVIEKQLQRLEPLQRVYTQAELLLEYEKEHGVTLYLTDEIAGSFLLEQREYDQRQGIIVMLAAIVLLSGIFPGEQRHQMMNLLRCTKHGRRPLFWTKMSLGAVLSILAAFGMFLSKLASVQALYDFRDWHIPIQSFEAARHIKGNMSLMQFLTVAGFLELAGVCCLAFVFLALTLWMKNRMYAILLGSAVFVLPLLLGWIGVTFPWKYTGNRVFFFLCQMAEEGVVWQWVYLVFAAFAAGISIMFAWKKYQNRSWRWGNEAGDQRAVKKL